ncbi:MAG: hypothetical protein N3D16_02665 [Anaerolineales bacterium]|nr:hypothetical protein [Anaerolineales bacterium]
MLVFILCFVAAGIALRIWSFQQNTRLYGDVNLFALTARQLASQATLTYPMKYDYTPQTPYLTLESPASQHPPLWPLLGAILARMWETQDTFLMLKALSLLAGLGVWLAFLPKIEDFAQFAKFVPFGLITISPWLVDFSSNGSPYILIALILLLADQLWRVDFSENLLWLSGISAFCAFAILTHSNLILLPLAFAMRIIENENILRQKKAIKLGIFCVLLLLFLSPYLIWNLRTFGQLFHSPSSYYLLEQLQIASITLDQNRVVWKLLPTSSSAILERYTLMLVKSLWAGARQYLEMITPIGAFFLLLPLSHLYLSRQRLRLKQHWWIKLFSPFSLYLLTIAFWATYKTRFLIPLLPITYRLVGEGIEEGLKVAKGRVWLIWLAVVALFLWTFYPYRQRPLNFYYAAETPRLAQQYDQMRNLAKQLAEQPKGVVLGISNNLDGGIETIYWARQPFVMARGFNKIIWRKLAIDFQAHYVWSECQQRERLQKLFPSSQLLLYNDLFCVLVIHP